MAVSTSQFIEAMRSFPAAVNIVTARGGEHRVGFTATAVMSLTAEPPQIAIAVNKGVSGLPTLLSAGAFCVSTLSARHSDIASRFAGSVKGSERFETGEWLTLATGAPALSDAVLNLDCRLVQSVEFSSHRLIVGEVDAIRVNNELKPLLYIDGGWACLLPGTDFGSSGYMDAVRRAMDVVNNAQQARPRDRLEQIVRELTHYYIKQRDVTRDQLRAEAYVTSEQMDDINRLKKSFDQRIVDLLNEGVNEGDFEVDDLRLAAFAISGVVTWVHRWYRSSGRLSPDEISGATAKLVDRMISSSRS
ncbi:MAG: flavin reductase [Xanthobacteraceae bacterium]